MTPAPFVPDARSITEVEFPKRRAPYRHNRHYRHNRGSCGHQGHLPSDGFESHTVTTPSHGYPAPGLKEIDRCRHLLTPLLT
jgi:hypothetical protein